MPQQLACPNCRMTVNVLEAFAAERTLCPGCRAEMAPVPESQEEAIVAEPDDPPPLVAVELADDARPPRPTVLVPHGPPPNFKPTPVAQAWTTVAHGLALQRWGVLVALVRPVGLLVLVLLDRIDLVRIAQAEDRNTPAAWAFFFLTYAVVAATGALLVIGRFYCYRVPPKTKARIWMAVASAGTAVATLFALVMSLTNVATTDERYLKVLHAGQLVALGLWLAAEWAFLLGLGRIGHFVKRPGLALFSYVTAVAAALVPGLGVAFVLRGSAHLILELEIAVNGLCVLYLFLLNAAQSAVSTRTPDEAVAPPA